jgi:hypothetical protein
MRTTHKKIAVLRNNVFGHSSMSMTPSDAFKRAGITPNEINDYMESAKNIVNTVSNAHSGEVHAFNLSAGSCVVRLLESMRKSLSGA